MEKYQRYATVVQLFAIILMGLRVALQVSQWFFPDVHQYISGGISEYDVTLFSFGQKLTGFLVEAVQAGLFMYGLVLVIKLMSAFKARAYFAVPTVLLIKKITKTALCYLVYTFFSRIVLSLVTSWHNVSGKRCIAVSFSSDDMINIMVFCALFLILTIFQRGYELKHEQDLTI